DTEKPAIITGIVGGLAGIGKEQGDFALLNTLGIALDNAGEQWQERDDKYGSNAEFLLNANAELARLETLWGREDDAYRRLTNSVNRFLPFIVSISDTTDSWYRRLGHLGSAVASVEPVNRRRHLIETVLDAAYPNAAICNLLIYEMTLAIRSRGN